MLETLDNIQVVLVRPRFPENIGSTARVVANTGLGGLRLVAPERLWEEPMRRLATSQGADALDNLKVFPSLEAALADCSGALATTARTGEDRGRLIWPRTAAPHVLAWAARGPAALVFGPEDRGLTTAELDLCSESVHIPTTETGSLNLAQAVMVMAYEVRLAALNNPAGPRPRGPKPAALGELEALKDHLKEALVAINVLRSDNPDHFFRPIKGVLDRARPSAREVRALRGIARQILWLRGQLKDDE